MSRSHPVDPHGDPFTLHLAALMAEAPGATRDFTFSDVAHADEDIPIAGPVSGEAHLARTNRGLLLDGRFGTTLSLECSRCLRAIALPVEAVLEQEEVLPSIDLASGLPVRLEEGTDPETTRLTDHHELELRPLVLEAISLEEPIAPLCEPDCPGLCTICGQRLEAGHVHEDEEIDPRLAALRGFTVDAEDETG